MNKQILIALLGDISQDPRPLRMLNFCQKLKYKVTILTLPVKTKIPGIKYLEYSSISSPIQKIKKIFYYSFRQHEKLLCSSLYIEIKKLLRDKNFDFIICHDILLLPVFWEIYPHPMVIFDAREYYPAQREESILWKLIYRPFITWICKNYLKKCVSLITVCDGIKQEYADNFNVTMEIIRSIPFFSHCHPSPVSYPIKIIHHGVANRNRKIELMIDIFNYLPVNKFSFDLMLSPSGNDYKYYNFLKKYAARLKNVNIIPPVDYTKIISTINKYDIGLYLLFPSGKNLWYSLPNKLFEFIQANLMVAISPLPEMKKIVDAYECGIISKNFSPKKMAEELASLTPDEVYKFKVKSHTAAHELCFEKEQKKLEKIFHKIIS